MMQEYTHGSFIISTDKSRLDTRCIQQMLSATWWAKEITEDEVKRSVEHAISYGIYDDEKQVGFARVITDHATFAYLSDVVILKEYRGRGLSKWLMECIMNHPSLQKLRRFLLATTDAHSLYERFGFKNLANPGHYMELLNVDNQH